LKTNPIKTAFATLRPGDTITSLNCDHCASNHIVVLERDPGGSLFQLSRSSARPGFVLDVRGPYHWKGEHKMFFDKAGQPHDHIVPKSEVVEGAGMDALLQYRSLPSLDSVRYAIAPEDLPGIMYSDVERGRIESLFARLAVAKDRNEQVGTMQLIVQEVFGRVELNEKQMRGILLVMNSFAGTVAAQQRSASSMLNILAALGGLGGLMSVEVVELGEFGFNRSGRSSRTRQESNQH
jgi:hypothetical protein